MTVQRESSRMIFESGRYLSRDQKKESLVVPSKEYVRVSMKRRVYVILRLGLESVSELEPEYT